MRKRVVSWLVGAVLVLFLLPAGAPAQPAPAQRLPSALLIYPLVDTDGGFSRDTRIELLNLTRRPIDVRCFYVERSFCGEIGFFVRLTPNQPLSWLVSKGTFNTITSTAVPPFSGVGELKCAVVPSAPDLEAHNAIQGRGILFGSDGQTFGYGAVGIQRLTPGEFTGVLDLDGSTYSACPGEQHFLFLASEPLPSSAPATELVIAPCTEDLENQIPTSTTVQFSVINEFEQHLSASINVDCYKREFLRRISSVFTSNTLGSETGHLIVRGIQNSVTAMLLDRFETGSAVASAANEPALTDGQAARIRFP